MKKIIYPIAIALTALSVASCSLHDDSDYFGQSAAERIDAAIEADKSLLESAPNGWKLIYYTGTEYTGGGYTYLCKFKDGRATVAGDMSENYKTCTSSYNVISDQSAVLTFDTYNELMHKFATPTSSSIDGEQGDYEFLITKATPDSIVLKGKKWGNKMVMTPMPASLPWKDYIDSVNTVAKKVFYNNKVTMANDSIGHIDIDDYTRRAVYKSGKEKTEVPYYVSSKGIHFQSPIIINGEEVSELVYNKAKDNFDVAGTSDINIHGFNPPHFQPIEFFEGTWNLICHQAGSNSEETQQALEYRIEMTKYNPVYLKGKINIDGLAFDLYFQYFRDKGAIALIQQYADDPTHDYAYANVAPVSFSAGGRFNWTGTLYGNWHDDTSSVVFTWNNIGESRIDSYVFLASNSSGQPVYNESGQLISLAQLTYLQGMKRVNH